MLNYGGIVHASTVDYPGQMAITIFLRGCSVRCQRCHNKQLWEGQDMRPIEYVFDEIKRCMPFIGAVVVSGGEPAEQPAIAAAIADYAHDLGLKAGLHTSGRPKRPNLYEHFDFIMVSPPVGECIG